VPAEEEEALTEIVRAGLVQQGWTGDKESMIGNAIDAIGVTASEAGAILVLTYGA
jgi:beta-ureidopropionase